MNSPQNTSQYFSWTSLSILAEHLSVFWQKTSLYFGRTPLSILAEHFSIFLQNTSQCFGGTLLSILAKRFHIFLQTTYYYFCRISSVFWKSDYHLPKKLFYLLQWKPFKNGEKVLFFTWKAFLVLKTLKFLSGIFGYVGKTTWLKRYG